MRYLYLVLIFCSFGLFGQSQGVTNSQTKLRPNQLRWSPTDATLDSVYIIRADTATGEPGWYLVTLGGGGNADTTLAGDVVGGLNSTFVRKINGVTVENKTPQGREVLQYDGTQWTPDSIDLEDLPQMNASRVLGRGSSSAGDVTQLTPSNGVKISGNYIESDLTAGTGINISGTTTLTVSNSAPDQIVTISGATGTYPNFTVTGLTQLETLGTLYDSTLWNNLSGFTIVGSPTASVSSNKINVSGGNQAISATIGTNNTAFNQVLRVSSYGGTMLEKNKVTLKFKVNVTPAATTYGVAVGTYSINASSAISNSVAYFNMGTGTGTGKVYVLAGTGNTTVAVSTTALSFSQNDYIILTYERMGDKVLVSARNQTTNSSPVTALYVYNTTIATGVLMPNTSNFAIVNLGGAYIVDSLNITSNETKNANVMFVGDSKFSGYSSGYEVGIPQLFNRYYGGSISCSGQSDRSQDVLNHIAQIIALAPRTVVLCIGRNDLSAGVPSGTYQSNIASIVSQLESAGITVRLLDGIYESVINQTALLSHITSTYPTKYIGTYAPSNTTGSLSSDNVHPTYLGSKIVTAVIYQSLLTDNGKYLNKKPEGLALNTTFDSVRVFGTFRVGQITYPPTQSQASDIIVSNGAAIRAAHGANNQENAIVLANTTNAGMDFRSYTGGSYPSSSGGFRWYTAGTTTGTQAVAMNLTTNGVLKIGSSVSDFPNAAAGDVQIGYNARYWGGNTTMAGFNASWTPFNAAGNSELRNYYASGELQFFTSGGVSGSQARAMTIMPLGYVGIATSAPNSTLHASGSIATAYRAITALRTLDITDHTIEITANTFTVTLPTAVGITGRKYVITNSGSGVTTIATTSSQTFVNVVATPTTLTVNQFGTVTVQSNGTNWLRLSSL